MCKSQAASKRTASLIKIFSKSKIPPPKLFEGVLNSSEELFCRLHYSPCPFFVRRNLFVISRGQVRDARMSLANYSSRFSRLQLELRVATRKNLRKFALLEYL